MRLIGLAVILTVSLVLAPLAVEAQEAIVPRIGFLGAVTPEDFPHLDEGFRQGLRDSGYVEGQNIVIVYRWAEGNAERLPDLAVELVQLNVNGIFAITSAAARELRDLEGPARLLGLQLQPMGVESPKSWRRAFRL